MSWHLHSDTWFLCCSFSGHTLLHTQEDIPIDGWAVECRVYAEVSGGEEGKGVCRGKWRGGGEGCLWCWSGELIYKENWKNIFLVGIELLELVLIGSNWVVVKVKEKWHITFAIVLYWILFAGSLQELWTTICRQIVMLCWANTHPTGNGVHFRLFIVSFDKNFIIIRLMLTEAFLNINDYNWVVLCLKQLVVILSLSLLWLYVDIFVLVWKLI